MTISTETCKAQGLGNGVQTQFDYDFLIERAEDAELWLSDAEGNSSLIQPTNYLITGLGRQSGGKFIYPLSGTPIPTGQRLTLLRIVPYTQDTNFSYQSAYYPKVVEEALDTIVQQIQQLVENASRTLHVPVPEGAVPDLPGPNERADMLLGFDAGGNYALVPSGGPISGLFRFVMPQTFGAAMDGTTDDTAAWGTMLAYMAAQYNVGRPVMGLCVGISKISGSLPIDAPITLLGAVKLIASQTGNFTAIPYWNGQPSGKFAIWDLRFAGRGVERARFVGNFMQAAESGTIDSLSCIGSSQRILVSPTGYTIPNVSGTGGSNSVWDLISADGLGHIIYTPGLGAPVPSTLTGPMLGLYGSSAWQASPVLANDSVSYVQMLYAVGDVVTNDRRVFRCAVAGTTHEEPTYTPNYGTGVNAAFEFITDSIIPGLPMWQAGTAYAIGQYIWWGNNTYRVAATILDSGIVPPTHQGATTIESAVTAWAVGQTVAAGDYRSNGGRFYRCTASAGNPTAGGGPVQSDGSVSNDGQGNFWAYAGPAALVQWTYVRVAGYNASGTGLVIQKSFANNGLNDYYCSSTAMDDCHILAHRSATARSSPIQINGGFLRMGPAFLEPASNCAKYGAAGGGIDLNNEGEMAVQVFGTLICDHLYIGGEWNRGILAGDGARIDLPFTEPDSGFKTSFGSFLDTHPNATKMQVTFRAGPEYLTALSQDYILVTAGAEYDPGVTLTGVTGWAGSLLVLNCIRLPATPTAPMKIIVRQLGGGLPPPGATVTDGTTVGTVQGKTVAGLLPAGIVATNDLPFLPSSAGNVVIRQIDLNIPGLQRSYVPFFQYQASTANFQSTDNFICTGGDDSSGTLWRYSAGSLVPMGRQGFYNGGTIAAQTQLLMWNGEIQYIATTGAAAQIKLPSRLAGDYVPLGKRLQLRITIGGTGPTAMFFTDGTHPAPRFYGGTPPFAASTTYNLDGYFSNDGTTLQVTNWSTG